MALQVIDRAIQAFGAEGVSQDTELASLWAGLRTLRIADVSDCPSSIEPVLTRPLRIFRALMRYDNLLFHSWKLPLTSERFCVTGPHPASRTTGAQESPDVGEKGCRKEEEGDGAAPEVQH